MSCGGENGAPRGESSPLPDMWLPLTRTLVTPIPAFIGVVGATALQRRGRDLAIRLRRGQEDRRASGQGALRLQDRFRVQGERRIVAELDLGANRKRPVRGVDSLLLVQGALEG